MPGRLTRRSEFLRVAEVSARARRRFVTDGVIVQAAKRDSSSQEASEADGTRDVPFAVPRFGYTATKKIGGAVVRNRVKRRLRAVVREIAAHADPHHDYVLIGRAATADRDFERLRGDVETALRRLNLWHEAIDASNPDKSH